MKQSLPSWARGLEDISDQPAGSEGDPSDSDGGDSDLGGDDGGCCVECFGEPALITFKGVAVLTVAAALASVGCHGWMVFTADVHFKEATLRFCGVLFAMVVVLAELEVKRLISEIDVLESWFARGLFYVNAGALQLHLNGTLAATKMAEAERAVAVAMLGCGMLYCLMGMCCLKHLKEASLIMQRHREQRQQLRGSRSWETPLDSSTNSLAWPPR